MCLDSLLDLGLGFRSLFCFCCLFLSVFLLHSCCQLSHRLFQVLLMLARQEQWEAAKDPQFVFLSSDSSMQSGTDWQMTLEDSVPRKHCHLETRHQSWESGKRKRGDLTMTRL